MKTQKKPPRPLTQPRCLHKWELGESIRGRDAIQEFWGEANAGELVLSSTPIVVDANAVFTAEEMAERERNLAARVKQLLPIMPASEEAKGKPDTAELTRGKSARCWACDDKNPSGTGIVPRTGWVSRPQPGNTMNVEVYCPVCFSVWGWPSV